MQTAEDYAQYLELYGLPSTLRSAVTYLLDDENTDRLTYERFIEVMLLDMDSVGLVAERSQRIEFWELAYKVLSEINGWE